MTTPIHPAEITREPFFFGPDNQAMYAMAHRPAVSNGKAVLFCAPFADEVQRSYRLMYNFAESLAACGYLVLRFDYRGCGDSRMMHVETDISSRLEDIGRALQLVREKYGISNIFLLGLRFGASLACQVAVNNSAVAGLILWEPILQGREYYYESLRSNIATQAFVYREVKYNRDQLVANLDKGVPLNIDGYEVNKRLFEDGCNIDLAALAPGIKSPALLVSIVPEKKPVRSARVEAIGQFVASIPNAVHTTVNELPFWVNKVEYVPTSLPLYSVTLDWLEKLT